MAQEKQSLHLSTQNEDERIIAMPFQETISRPDTLRAKPGEMPALGRIRQHGVWAPTARFIGFEALAKRRTARYSRLAR
jgi:hypothetical protein